MDHRHTKVEFKDEFHDWGRRRFVRIALREQGESEATLQLYVPADHELAKLPVGANVKLAFEPAGG